MPGWVTETDLSSPQQNSMDPRPVPPLRCVRCWRQGAGLKSVVHRMLPPAHPQAHVCVSLCECTHMHTGPCGHTGLASTLAQEKMVKGYEGQVRREGLSGFSHNSPTLPPCQVPGRLSDISLESCGLRGPCPPQMSRRKDTGKLFQNQFRLYKPLGASKPDSGRCPYGHTPRVKTGCLKHLIPRSHHLLELSLQMPPSLALGSEQCRMSPS